MLICIMVWAFCVFHRFKFINLPLSRVIHSNYYKKRNVRISFSSNIIDVICRGVEVKGHSQSDNRQASSGSLSQQLLKIVFNFFHCFGRKFSCCHQVKDSR